MSRFEKKFRKEFFKDVKPPEILESIKQRVDLKPKPKPKFPRWIIYATCAVLVLMVGIITPILIHNSNKIDVTYKGMTASSYVKETKINQRKPLIKPHSFEAFDPGIDVIIDDEIGYYAVKEEEILITVLIDNPKQFEILSFTLNGKLYQTYEFKEGSNSDQIKVLFKVSNTSGLQNITIDAIKYVDGSNIKNAKFGADRTIKIGIKYDEAPSVLINSCVFNKTDAAIDLDLNIPSSLEGIITSSLIYLYDGEKIVYQKNLNKGNNKLEFDNLEDTKTYEYIVVVVYDALDAKGRSAKILIDQSFTTESLLNITNEEITTSSISFKLEKENVVIKTMSLYKQDEKIKDLSAIDENYSIDDLMSNTEYEIRITYLYGMALEKISSKIYQFKTEKLDEPTIILTTKEITSSTVTFNLEFNDSNDLITIDSFIVKKDEFEANIDLISYSITNLSANTNYEVILNYHYDLNDGQGRIDKTINLNIDTLLKTKPIISLSSSTTNDTINYSVSIIDPDESLSNYVVKLIKDSDIIEQKTTINGTFNNLLTGTKYLLKVEYEYNLGAGLENDLITKEISTLTITPPKVSIDSCVAFGNDYTINYSIDNPNELLNFDSIKIFDMSNNLLTTIDNISMNENTVSVNLNYNNQVKIVACYHYDLNNGEGIIYINENNLTEDNYLVYGN